MAVNQRIVMQFYWTQLIKEHNLLFQKTTKPISTRVLSFEMTQILLERINFNTQKISSDLKSHVLQSFTIFIVLALRYKYDFQCQSPVSLTLKIIFNLKTQILS